MSTANNSSLTHFVKNVLCNAYYSFNKKQRSVFTYRSFEDYQIADRQHLLKTEFFRVRVYTETPYETRYICSWTISQRFLSYLIAKMVFPLNDLQVVIDSNVPRSHPHTDFSFILD